MDNSANFLEKQSPENRVAGETMPHITNTTPQVGEKTLENVGLGNIEKCYNEMFGRELDAKQVKNLLDIARMLELKNDDGIWVILLALENYQRLYLEAPGNIVTACRQIIQEAKDENTAAAARAVAEEKAAFARIAKQQKFRVSKTFKIVAGAVSAVVVAGSIVTGCFAYFLVKWQVLAATGQQAKSDSLFGYIYNLFI